MERSDSCITVIVRQCGCGHSEQYVSDVEPTVPPCPCCGGSVLLSGSGFVGPEGYSLAFTCRSCHVTTRVSKRHKSRNDNAEPNMTVNGQLGRCA
jgi:hypothetical protein